MSIASAPVLQRLSWLLAACAVLLAAQACRAADVPAVTQAQLQARLAARDAGLVVLDVRAPDEFAAGHVPGAINVPHDQVEARIAELRGARDRDVVVYCRSGRRSALALDTLARLGFTRLGHLEGDWLAWEAAGLPAQRAAGTPPSSGSPPAQAPAGTSTPMTGAPPASVPRAPAAPKH